MSTKHPRRISPQNSAGRSLARSDTVTVMAMGRLRSIPSSTAVADAPLSEQDELARKLRAREISLEQYYDATVELGLAHLRNHVSPEQLEIVRERMREEVETNPILTKMVRDAIGALAEPEAR